MLNFKTTAELKVSTKIAEQIIGQDQGLQLIKKAAQHRRHILLIGHPGTGKSLLGQALAELLPIGGELQDVLCYPNEKDPNNPIIKAFPAEEGEKTIVKLRSSFENSLSSRRFYLLIMGSIFLFFLAYFLWGAFKESPYGPIAIVQGVSTVIWILFIGFILFSRAPGFLKTLTGLAMIPKPLITHKKNDPAPFLDACLLPGQKVFTNPYPIEIEKTAGNVVYNAKGKTQKVTNVEKIKWKGKIYHIKPRLLFQFTATPNHPFLVLERPKTKQFKLREFKKISKNLEKHIRWKKTRELNEGDMLIYPELKHPQEYKVISFINKKTRKVIKERVVLDEGVAEILGWFLAEGHTRNQEEPRRGEVGFTLGIHEHKEAERLAELIENKFGIKVKFDFHNSHSIGLVINSKTLSEWFEKEFGKGAKNKRIPKLIFESPKKVKLKFLEAYVKGDGFESEDVIAMATTSKNVSEDLVFLFSSLGIFPTCSFRKMKDSKVGGRILKGPEIYELQIGGKQQHKLGKEKGKFQHYFSKDNLHFIPIRRIQTQDYEGDIINMETEDGTYLMPCITHNTGSHSGALLGDVLHDPLQSFFTTTRLQQINKIKDKRNVLIEIQENKIKSIVDNLLKKNKDILIKKDNYKATYLRNKELQILSEKNNEIEPTTILSVNKYKSDKPYLIKLTTESGKILLVTPEHKVAVKRFGRIIYKEAEKLTRFDKAVIKT